MGQIFGMLVGMVLIGGAAGWAIGKIFKLRQPWADAIGLIGIALVAGYSNSPPGEYSVSIAVSYGMAGLAAFLILHVVHLRQAAASFAAPMTHDEPNGRADSVPLRSPTTVTERLGYFLFWTGTSIAAVIAAFGLFATFYHPLAPDPAWIVIIPMWIAALIIWALGRGVKYVLAGK